MVLNVFHESSPFVFEPTPWHRYSASPLLENCQVASFQRCEPALSSITSAAGDTTARPPSPTAADPSALPSPTSSPSSSQSLFLPVHSMPAPVCQLLSWTTVLFKELYYKIKNGFVCVCLLVMYYLCEKYYKPIRVQYYIANCVSRVPRLDLLDLWTNWTYDCTLRIELTQFKCKGLTVIIIPDLQIKK